MSCNWIHQLLQAHLSEEEYQKLKPQLDADYWASPSARQRIWASSSEELPLRFQLNLDIQV